MMSDRNSPIAHALELATAEFLLDKARLLDRLRGRINERQEQTLLRMLREGPEGVKVIPVTLNERGELI